MPQLHDRVDALEGEVMALEAALSADGFRLQRSQEGSTSRSSRTHSRRPFRHLATRVTDLEGQVQALEDAVSGAVARQPLQPSLFGRAASRKDRTLRRLEARIVELEIQVTDLRGKILPGASPTASPTPTSPTSTSTTSVSSSPSGPPSPSPSPSATTACAGVAVTPTSNITALVDKNPARTRFCFAAGTYRLSNTIATGTKFPILDLRAGAILDGQNGAFIGVSATDAPAGQTGLQILGGTFQHFGNATAPIWVNPLVLVDGGVVIGAEFRENFNAGLAVQGDNARVTDVYTHHNGRYGLVVNRACSSCPGPVGIVIEDSEIFSNNTRRLATNGDAGGTKFSGGTSGMIVRRNVVHDNYGSGLWWDGYNKNAQVYDNTIFNNSNWGIFWERSYGGAKIHNNMLTNNGLGGTNPFFNNVQLLISCSDGSVGGIEIYQNTIDGTAYPLVLLNHINHPLRTRNVYVHDNVMTLRGGGTRTGGYAASGLVELFGSGANNRFDRNTYRISNTSAAYWAWDGRILTWSQWRAYGRDPNGVVQTIT